VFNGEQSEEDSGSVLEEINRYILLLCFKEVVYAIT
jgi:hypothetical protein